MRLRSEVWQYGKIASSSDQPLDIEAHTLFVKVTLGTDGMVSLAIETLYAAPSSTAPAGSADEAKKAPGT